MGGTASGAPGGGGSNSWLADVTDSKLLENPSDGTSGKLNTNIIPFIRYTHAAMLTGINPDTAGWTGGYSAFGSAMSIWHDILLASRAVGGSPYASVESFNPDSRIASIDAAVDAAQEAASAYDAEAAIETMLAEALAAMSSAGLFSDSRITALMNATDLRSRTEFLADMDDIVMGAYDRGAINAGQLPFVIAAAATKRSQGLSEAEQKYRMAFEQSRSEAAIAFVSTKNDFRAKKVAMLIQSAGLEVDASRMEILAKNDQIEKDLEYEEKDIKWDLNLTLEYLGNAMAQGMGTAVPRAPTKGERLLSAFATSFSFGAQVGGATANPLIGALAGGGSLLTQLFLTK